MKPGLWPAPAGFSQTANEAPSNEQQRRTNNREAPPVHLTLEEPLIVDGSRFYELTLQPPTPSDFADLGDPVVAVDHPRGVALMEDMPTIRRYLRRCIRDERARGMLDLLSLADTMRLHRVLLLKLAIEFAPANLCKALSSRMQFESAAHGCRLANNRNEPQQENS